jgi:ABC-type transport system substrate-binding protein
MIGQTLAGRYEIRSELGRGGMGIVYLAQDPVLEREVAIKLIPPNLINEETEERLQREAKLVAGMDHPAIIPVFDLGLHEGHMFFVMPVVHGTNLGVLIRAGAVGLGDMLEVGIQVGEALDYSHSRGVLHRDIKPENIMVPRERRGPLHVRVMDFGLARADVHSRITHSGALVGTVTYLSPEQVTGGEVDHRSDIYSLGAVLYECLAGKPPFMGQAHSILHQIVYEEPPPLPSLATAVDPELEDLVLRCQAKDPAARPQRAREIVEILTQYRDTLNEQDLRTTLFLPGLTTRAAPPDEVPLVGRKKELEALAGRLDRADGGECQFVLVGGSEGIGKGRLLEEFEKQVDTNTHRVLHGRFVEQDPGFPFYGFCELIQGYFRAKEAESGSSGIPDFSDLAPDLMATFPMLSEIPFLRRLGEGSDTAAPPDIQKAENRMVVFELLARTLARIGSARPLVLLLEDLHQSGVSLEALQYVVLRLGPTATLFVGTYQPEAVDRNHPLSRLIEGFKGDRHFQLLQLAPLSPSEHLVLLSEMLGGIEIDDDLAEQLYEITDGNPFFTKDLVQSLMDFGVIQRSESGSWFLPSNRQIADNELPSTIQQTVDRRIRNLPGEQRETLLLASVLGKTFDFDHLEAVAPEDLDVDETVDRLIEAGILEEVRQSREYRLAFSSGAVADVLYGSLTRRKKRAIHRRIAAYLEDRHAARLDRVAASLFRHYAGGDVPEKAVAFGIQSAGQSLESFNPKEALRTLKQLLDFLDDGQWEGAAAMEGEAWFLQARANRMAGNVEVGHRAAERAVTAFRRVGDRGREAEAMCLAAETAWEGRQIDAANRWVEAGLELTQENASDSRLELLSLGATLANLRGEHEKAREYLKSAQSLRRTEPEAETLEDGGRIVVGVSGSLSVLEPALAATNDEIEILANIFEPLFTTDAQGNLTPLLCESWEERDGGRTFILTLRDSVRFHDGHVLTAHDVKASFERAIRLTSTGTPSAVRTAFAYIQGVQPIREGGAETGSDPGSPVEGIVVLDDHRLRIDLREPLPIFPSLLTNPQAAVVRVVGSDKTYHAGAMGTGPFRVAEMRPDRIVLGRNDAYWRTPATLDRVEFRLGLTSAAIAEGLRSGNLDLAHDLQPSDLETVLRDPRFRSGMVEAPEKNTFFILFNVASPAVANPALRRILARVLRIHDLVWRTLGRFGDPATGIIPPGIIGHHPGRRLVRSLGVEEARRRLETEGGAVPPRLRAAVHPAFMDRYRSLFDGIVASWKELGIAVEVETASMKAFVERWEKNEGIDVWMGRYVADYDDADNFTYGLFHSKIGLLRNYVSSPEVDEITERARTESEPAVREALYHQVEKALVKETAAIPLFHSVAYRLAAPHIRRLRLGNRPPFVNYSEVARGRAPCPTAARPFDGRVLEIPMMGKLRSLDPALSRSTTAFETLTNVYETLTKVTAGARVDPWLAAEIKPQDGGRAFAFRLREDIRFHNGRRLTARDVRYSFERLLRSQRQGQVLLPIRGAAEIMESGTGELEGFKVQSASEFTVELLRPVSIFPMLLSHPTTAILPEEAHDAAAVRPVGTGPFRIVHSSEERLELEANPDYWRSGYPRSSGLVFVFNVPANEIYSEFRAGRFSLAMDLDPASIEKLRYDSSLAGGYRESPGLATAILHFNTRRGPLEDIALRRHLLTAVDVEALLHRVAPRSVSPSTSMIPPALLGQQPARSRSAARAGSRLPGDLDLRAAVMPIPREYPRVARELFRVLRKAGVRVRTVNETVPDFFSALEEGTVDLLVGRWSASYPDADSFFHQLYDPRVGYLRKFYGNEELDRLVTMSRAEFDPAIRRSLFLEIENLLFRDAVLLPLFHERLSRFLRPELRGLKLSFSYPTVAYEELEARKT